MGRTRQRSHVYAVTEAFLKHRVVFEGRKFSTDEMVSIIKKALPEVPLTRENFFDYIGEGLKSGIIEFNPPEDMVFPPKIREMFDIQDRSDGSIISVVDSTIFDSKAFLPGAHVTSLAATLVLKLIKELAKMKNSGTVKDKAVTLGFGPGRTTLSFCRFLSKKLQHETEPLKLKLVALSGGCLGTESQLAPTSFFNLFPEWVESVGLFAETLIECQRFSKMRSDFESHPGLEAFAERERIDIIVTSVGDIDDDHDLLASFYKAAKNEPQELKTKSGYVGSVLYRPYSASGPIEETGDQLRAVSLFELKELVQRVKTDRNKYHVVLAHSCPSCSKPRRSRAVALHPLLANKNLRLWTHLIMDIATAKELVAR